MKRIPEVEQGLLSGNVFEKSGMEEKNRMNADAAMPLDLIVTADCQRKMTYSEKSVKD